MANNIFNKILKFIKLHRKLILNLLSLVMLGLIVVYLVNSRDVLARLWQIAPYNIMLISLMCIANVFTNSLINYFILRMFEIKISLKETFLLQYSNNLLNKITPRGGIIFRGMYIKSIYGFDYSKFFVVVAGFYVISFSANALWGLISALFIYLDSGEFNTPIILFFLGILFSMLFLIFFSIDFSNRKEKVFEVLTRMIEGWSFLKRNHKILLLVLLSLLMITFTALQQFFVYSSLEENASFWEIVFLTSIGNLSILVNLTPGGIGIKEAILVFSANVIPIDSEIIVLGSMLTRIIAFLTSAVLGGVSYRILSKKLQNKS